MKILFVCRYNRFRSKVAEAIFNHYNKDETIQAKSAGISRDVFKHYVAKNVHKILGLKRIKITDDVGQKVNDYLIRWADKIIVVADNVNPTLFPKDKVEVWLVKDCDETEEENVNDTINDIKDRVKEFLENLKQ